MIVLIFSLLAACFSFCVAFTPAKSVLCAATKGSTLGTSTIPHAVADIPSAISASMEVPDIKLPSINVESFTATLPRVDIPSSGEMMISSDMALPAMAILVSGMALLLLTANSSNKGEIKTISPNESRRKSISPPKSSKNIDPVNSSVNYDAPAQFAYGMWCAENDAKVNAEAYVRFKKIYEEKAVADATAKKLARDLNNFTNQLRG